MPSICSTPGIAAQGFEIVLIGLDGGIKLRQDSSPEKDNLFFADPLAELYALIDGMPMRRAEMRRQGG
jgi:hypothetical protein